MLGHLQVNSPGCLLDSDNFENRCVQPKLLTVHRCTISQRMRSLAFGQRWLFADVKVVKLRSNRQSYIIHPDGPYPLLIVLCTASHEQMMPFLLMSNELSDLLRDALFSIRTECVTPHLPVYGLRPYLDLSSEFTCCTSTSPARSYYMACHVSEDGGNAFLQLRSAGKNFSSYILLPNQREIGNTVASGVSHQPQPEIPDLHM